MVIIAIKTNGDVQLNISETVKIRTCSVSAKLEDPDDYKKNSVHYYINNQVKVTCAVYR